MNCQKAGDLLSTYIEGELTGRQGEALETHLGRCAGCREELATLRSAVALLKAPRTLVRPEGLLEEFKAKYLPEAETAPRWAVRLPVMPKIEWPSLGRVMLPMGGLAAAAAALLVTLHSQQVVVGPSAAGLGAGVSRVATLPAHPEAGPDGTATAPAPGVTGSVTPRWAHVVKPPAAGRGQIRPRFSEHWVVTGSRRTHRRSRHQASAVAADVIRPARRKHQRSHGALLAIRDIPVLLVPAAPRHADAEPSPEAQWQDQVVMIQRKAVTAAAEDGYAEASSKDLATGVTRSVAIGAPPEPAAAAPGPVAGDANRGK